MITREEHKIVARYLDGLIDWERIYDDSPEYSKQNFSKKDILDHIRKLVLDYPDNIDTSVIKGRAESSTSVFAVRVGTLNDYVYILSKIDKEDFGWYMTDDVLLKIVDKLRKGDRYYVIVNYKHVLRNHKIKKLCQTITQTTNLALK